MQSFLRKHQIDFFTTNSEKKASIVERFNRTPKMRMFMYFTNSNTYRYIAVLPSLVDGYNASYNRSIKMQPRHVRRIHQLIIRQRLYSTTKKESRVYKYDIGTWVRISKQRQTFSKGYLPTGLKKYSCSRSSDATSTCVLLTRS